MAWLLTHMWISLAGVALFSLLFGWSMRGIMLVGKLRTARVDRDIARTELDQAKAEIEGLYAAQRNTLPGASAPASMADPSLRAELNVREKRLSELSAELSRSKAELQSLKSGAGRGTAPVAAKMASDQTEPSLLWRNRHLESRVQHLEAALHEQASAPAQALSAPVAAAAVSSGPAMDTAEIDKLKWQANFFKQRVEALEAELAIQTDPAPAPAPVAAPIESDDAGEELARLRWRNRFLEGRLAYFEGDSAAEKEGSAEAAELVDLAVDADEAPEDEDDVMSATDAILQELEEADAAADADEEDAFLEGADGDDAPDELEDDLDGEDDDDELENADVELEDEDEDEDEDLELEDDADVDDEAESDEEADGEVDDAYDEESDDEDPDGDDEEDLESDDADEDDEDALEDDESGEDDSEDDESDEDDEDDDADLEEDDLDEDDSDDDEESDDEEALDEDDEEIDEDTLDEADADDDGEIDEESDDDADEDDSEYGEDDAEAYEDAEVVEIPAERPIALPKAVAGSPDDLTIIGGIGPKIQEVLNELGIFHYDQIAAWSPANIAWVDDHLNFSGRIAREGWVEQAAILSGDVAED